LALAVDIAFTDLIRFSRLRPRKGVMSMDYVGVFLGALAILALTVDGLLRRFERPSRKFPWCHTCGKNMVNVGLSKAVPEEILRYLDKNKLPTSVASRFICPKGDYQLWFIPRFGSAEKAFFFKEEL
jgi:hypothetical protein